MILIKVNLKNAFHHIATLPVLVHFAHLSENNPAKTSENRPPSLLDRAPPARFDFYSLLVRCIMTKPNSTIC